MFGIGVPELMVIGVVAMLVFGPEKLPQFARQAGRFLRTVRRMADDAKNDLGREFGQDLSDVDLREIDPREYVRKNFIDDLDSSSSSGANNGTPAGQQPSPPLRPDERPPFDHEAT